MPTVHLSAPNAGDRSAECALAIFGLAAAVLIFCISLDLLLDGALTRAAGGAFAATSPAPDIPRPRPVPDAEGLRDDIA